MLPHGVHGIAERLIRCVSRRLAGVVHHGDVDGVLVPLRRHDADVICEGGLPGRGVRVLRLRVIVRRIDDAFREGNERQQNRLVLIRTAFLFGDEPVAADPQMLRRAALLRGLSHDHLLSPGFPRPRPACLVACRCPVRSSVLPVWFSGCGTAMRRSRTEADASIPELRGRIGGLGRTGVSERRKAEGQKGRMKRCTGRPCSAASCSAAFQEAGGMGGADDDGQSS